MIELTLRVDQIDYDSLLELLLPALIEQMEQNSLGRIFVRSPEAAKGAAKKLLDRMTQESRDEFLAKYLQQNSGRAAAALEEMARKNGVSLKVTQVSAKKL